MMPPEMPRGVRLVSWNLKPAPVKLDQAQTIVNTEKFALTTLAQIDKALRNPKAKVGWSLPQLVARLAAVGADVELDEGDWKGVK